MTGTLWLRWLNVYRQIPQSNDKGHLSWYFREAQSASSRSPNDVFKLPLPVRSNFGGTSRKREELHRLSALPHGIRIDFLSYLRLPDMRLDFCGEQYIAAGNPLNRLALASKG